MDVEKFMATIYGINRYNDSMRCTIGRFVVASSPLHCPVEIVSLFLGYSSKQVIAEFERIVRRNKRYGSPYKVSWNNISLHVEDNDG